MELHRGVCLGQFRSDHYSGLEKHLDCCLHHLMKMELGLIKSSMLPRYIVVAITPLPPRNDGCWGRKGKAPQRKMDRIPRSKGNLKVNMCDGFGCGLPKRQQSIVCCPSNRLGQLASESQTNVGDSITRSAPRRRRSLWGGSCLAESRDSRK